MKEIKLYDCTLCNAKGVYPMEGMLCPNCKKPLKNELPSRIIEVNQSKPSETIEEVNQSELSEKETLPKTENVYLDMSDNRLKQAKESWSKAPDQDVLKAVEKLDEYDLEIRKIILEEAQLRKAQKEEAAMLPKKEKSLSLEPLSPRDFKKGCYIERNITIWSSILMLWLFFGFFYIFYNFVKTEDYLNFVSNLKAASSQMDQVKPEAREMVEQLTPYIPTLEKLSNYFMLGTGFYVVSWVAIFLIHKKIYNRQKDGPLLLVILLLAWTLIHGWGAYLALPLPEITGIFNVAKIQTMPIVDLLLILSLLPCLRPEARVYYQYTAVDSEYFLEDHNTQPLNDSSPTVPVRELSSLAVFSIVLCLLPYIGFPMAIAAVRKISRSEGRLYGKTLAWISVVVNSVLLLLIVFGIIMGTLGSK